MSESVPLYNRCCQKVRVWGQMMYLIKGEKLNLQTKKNSETSDLFNHHILGYNPSISHYRRSHVPNRLYISPEHNISVMFKDFCSRYQDVNISYAYYYKKKKRPSAL